MQQGYREYKVPSCIKLPGIPLGNRECGSRIKCLFLLQRAARGIEINTLFGATIERDTGYHPYKSYGRDFASLVLLIEQGSVPSVREGI
jgi:hypothetical protein